MKFNEPATSGAWTPSPPAAWSAWPWTSPRRASTTSACASATPKATSRCRSCMAKTRGHRRRAGARRPRAGRQVRHAGAGHGGQEHGAAGLRPARRLRHEPRLRHLRPRRLPHARLSRSPTRSSRAALPPDSLEGKAEQDHRGNVANGFIGQNFSSIKFSGILCDFWAVNPEQLRQLFKHVWQREFSDDEIILTGERIWNLGRLFNLREGVEPDTIPTKLYAESGAHTRRGLGGQGHRHGGLQGRAEPSTTSCAAGTRTACRPRPSWPKWASTSASRAGRREKGISDATRDDQQQEVHRLPYVRAGLLRLPRGRLPALGRTALLPRSTRPPPPSRATPACRPAAPSARRPARRAPSAAR